MTLLATITPDQIDAWYTVAERIVERIGALLVLGLAIWAKVESKANAQRLDRQGLKDNELEMRIAATPAVVAVAPPAPAVVTPSKVSVDHKALADLLAPIVKTAMDAAAKPAAWPTPSPNLPKAPQ